MSSSRSTEFKDMLQHFSNDYKEHSNQHKNGHKPYNETGHTVLTLMVSKWKLIQQHDQT